MRGVGRILAAYAAAGAAAGGLLAALDFGLRARIAPEWLAHAAGLGVGAGAFLGATLGLGLCACAAVPWRAGRLALWAAIALGWTAFAVHELGLVPRLGGAHARLAWLALAAIGALAALGAALGHALTPQREALTDARAGGALGGSLVARLSSRRRVGLAATLVGAALGCAWLDARLFVDQYAYIHGVLRQSARLCALIAPLVAGLRVPYSGVAAAGALGLAALPLVTLSEQHGALISAFRTAPFVDLAADDLRRLTDLDVDGYPALLGGGDCAPLDPAVNPGALEQPGNGVDDNCRLGDPEAAALRGAPALQGTLDGRSASLVLITIDSLRADHVGSYGYRRPTTPNLDRWFDAGLRCQDAIAPGAYTTISVPALLRGVAPRRLAWLIARQTSRLRMLPAVPRPVLAEGEHWLNAHLLSLDVDHPPLPLLLQRAGMRTWAAVDDGGSGFLSPELTALGFQRFEYMPAQSGRIQDPEGDAQVARAALALLEARDAAPFFLWLHLFGVHAPDASHAGVPTFGRDMVARYDHEIAHADQVLGPVLELLARIERERPLVTVLTSDHGERFIATGRAHGSNLVDDEIRVPLLMRGAGVPRGSVPGVVSLLDVAPTLLARAGLALPDYFDGIDLLASEPTTRTVVLSDVWRYDATGTLEFDRVAAVSSERRFVFEPNTNSRRLYTRGGAATLLLGSDPVLERSAFTYLERTRPQPTELALP